MDKSTASPNARAGTSFWMPALVFCQLRYVVWRLPRPKKIDINFEKEISMGKLTVSLPDELHQRIRQELEERGITTAQFIEEAINTFFQHQKEDQGVKTRTLAFQVSEDLYQRIKEYLARYEQIYHRKLSQKEFVVGLIC